MTASKQRYWGFAPYKMDSKNRVSIKPAWRPLEGETMRLMFSRTHGLPVLKVLSEDAFNERVETVNQSDMTPLKKQSILASLYMLSREVTLNEQGKMSLPKDLCSKANMEPDSDIVLAGRGNYFEIWNQDEHNKVMEIEMNQGDEDQLGIL